MKKQDIIKQLKKIAKMSKTELIDFNCKLSLSDLEEKFKKPMITISELRMAELMEISDVSPMAVISELSTGEV